jgi:hypothetical protein
MATEVIEKEVKDMDYTDLTAELSRIKSEATGAPEKTQPEDDKKNIEDNPSGEKTPEQTADDKKEEFVFDDTTYKEKGWSDEQISVIRSKEEQLWHKEQFINKRNAEIGSSRKKEVEFSQKEQELRQRISDLEAKETELKDNFYNNPDEYNKTVSDKVKNQIELDRIAAEKRFIAAEQAVYSKVPDFADLLDKDIPEVIRQDGIKFGLNPAETEKVIGKFKRGEWRYIKAEDIIGLAEKARFIKEIRIRDEKIKELSTAPDEVGKKIQKIASQRPVISGGSSSKNNEKSVDDMTYEELQRELNEHKNKNK